METREVCVDTDIVIDYLRGSNVNQDILPNILKEFDVYISPISVYELFYGGFYSGKLESVEDVLDMLIPMGWTQDDSRKAAHIHVTISKAGEKLSVKDILIAGVCCSKGVPIVTRNIAHFKRIKELKVIDGTNFLEKQGQ